MSRFDPYEYCQPWGDWHKSVTDDAKAIAALMGWQIDRVYFSGFWSQGDGACFEGRLGYRADCLKAVKAYAPKDTELHKIAAAWQALQKRVFYSLCGDVRHSGRYCHEHSVSFDWEDNRGRYRDIAEDITDSAEEIARDFMCWIYAALEREYEYQKAWQWANAWEQFAEEMQQERASARQLVRDMREAIKAGIAAAPSICSALRSTLSGHIETWEELREKRDRLESDFSYWQEGKRLSIQEFAAANL